MQTITVNMPDPMAMMLNNVCGNSDIVKEELIKQLLAQHLEDIEDYMDAVRARDEVGENLSLEDAMKKYGVAG